MPEDCVWEVATAALEQVRPSAERAVPEEAKRLLADGWEPFAVSEACIWFRLTVATAISYEPGRSPVCSRL